MDIDMNWLFKEQIRLREEREALNAERERFNREKADLESYLAKENAKIKIENKQLEMKERLVTQKLEIIEEEYINLDRAKKNFQFEKKSYEKVNKFQQRPVQNITYIGTDFLFQGVDNEVALKKRYRDLLKIFHPDNLGGDTGVIQDINKEYDALKKKYS